MWSTNTLGDLMAMYRIDLNSDLNTFQKKHIKLIFETIRNLNTDVG